MSKSNLDRAFGYIRAALNSLGIAERALEHGSMEQRAVRKQINGAIGGYRSGVAPRSPGPCQ